MSVFLVWRTYREARLCGSTRCQTERVLDTKERSAIMITWVVRRSPECLWQFKEFGLIGSEGATSF
jgi:hypothetical protein